MPSLLDRSLIIVTGKGGVGKTTVATALGLAAAAEGRRTIVVEVGDQHRLPGIFGLPDPVPGAETELEGALSSTSVDPQRTLFEWIEAQPGGRVPARVLSQSNTFQYFVAAAPGAKEVVTMTKVWELAQTARWRKRASGYDLVVVDAPSSGHALAMLRAPRTFAAIARVGPIANQAARVSEFLDDPGHSAYIAVAQGSEMAVTETIELETRLRRQLGRRLEAVVVNGVLPRRFSTAELKQISSAGGGSQAARSASRAAREVHERARHQHNQIARLRRHHLAVHNVPFVFEPELELPALREISERLRGSL